MKIWKFLFPCIVCSLLLGCTCNPPTQVYSLYPSRPDHSEDDPLEFTVLNDAPMRTPSVNNDLYFRPEERPEYSEVYVFDKTQPCKQSFEGTGCPIVWKATTVPEKSPWKIRYGFEGDELNTVTGPVELRPGNTYLMVVGLRSTGCIRQIGWRAFTLAQGGGVTLAKKPAVYNLGVGTIDEHEKDIDWRKEERDRLNRLATQYEKLNGHPLLPFIE